MPLYGEPVSSIMPICCKAITPLNNFAVEPLSHYSFAAASDCKVRRCTVDPLCRCAVAPLRRYLYGNPIFRAISWNRDSSRTMSKIGALR